MSAPSKLSSTPSPLTNAASNLLKQLGNLRRVGAAGLARSRSREITGAGRAGWNCRPGGRLRSGNAHSGQRCELERLDRFGAVVPVIFVCLRPSNWPMNKESLLLHKSAVCGATRATRHSAQPLLLHSPHDRPGTSARVPPRVPSSANLSKSSLLAGSICVHAPYFHEYYRIVAPVWFL